MPSPFSSMYGATKAFLSQFAACLAVEVKSRGVDVMSVHPSPVASRFYDKTHKMEMLDMVSGVWWVGGWVGGWVWWVDELHSSALGEQGPYSLSQPLLLLLLLTHPPT